MDFSGKDKKIAFIALSLAFLLLAAGCSNFSIHRYSVAEFKKIKEGGSTKGVPFYIMMGEKKQTTVYYRTWLEVQFILKDILKTDSFPVKSTPFPVSPKKWANARQEIFRTFMGGITGSSDEVFFKLQSTLYSTGALITVADIGNETNLVPSGGSSAQCAYKLNPPDKLDESLVSNVVETIPSVDYSAVYTFNAWHWLFSATEATFKLDDNGTLGEGTAKVDTTKVADALPFKSYAEKLLGIGAMAAVSSEGQRPAPEPRWALEIDVHRVGYKYTLETTDAKAMEKNGPLTFSDSNINIKQTEITASGEEKREGEKSYKFSGSVVPPK